MRLRPDLNNNNNRAVRRCIAQAQDTSLASYGECPGVIVGEVKDEKEFRAPGQKVWWWRPSSLSCNVIAGVLFAARS
jgi:hypothetical protein